MVFICSLLLPKSILHSMRIVVFASNIPPLRNPRSFRMTRHLPLLHSIADLLVISSPNPATCQMDESYIRRHGLAIKQNSRLRSGLKSIGLFRFLHRYLFPDDKLFHQLMYLFYYIFRYRKRDDIILTVSHPFSSHLTGWILKKWFGHRWIIDVGDLYAEPLINNSWIASLKSKFERLVLSSCEHIVVNAESLKNYFIKRYKIEPSKCSVIENGVHLDFSKMQRIEHQELNLVYIGNTYPRTREAIAEIEHLLKLVKALPELNIKIRLYGMQHQGIYDLQKQYKEFLEISRCDSDQELLQAYGRADFLINFANKNNPGLPSKLREYMCSGLPIIHYKHQSIDAAEEYLSKHNANFISCLLNSNSIDELINFLKAEHKIFIPDRQVELNPLEQWKKIFNSDKKNT